MKCKVVFDKNESSVKKFLAEVKRIAKSANPGFVVDEDRVLRAAEGVAQMIRCKEIGA